MDLLAIVVICAIVGAFIFAGSFRRKRGRNSGRTSDSGDGNPSDSGDGGGGDGGGGGGD